MEPLLFAVLFGLTPQDFVLWAKGIGYTLTGLGGLGGLNKYVVTPWRKRTARLVEIHTMLLNHGNKLEEMSKQFQRNGGQMLKDDVINILAEVAGLQVNLSRNWALFHAALNDAERGLIKTDADGQVIWINNKLCQMLECREADVYGHNWKNTICERTRTDFLTEWEYAFKDKRNFYSTSCFQSMTGKVFTSEVRGTAMKDTHGHFFGYLITVAIPKAFHNKASECHNNCPAMLTKH